MSDRYQEALSDAVKAVKSLRSVPLADVSFLAGVERALIILRGMRERGGPSTTPLDVGAPVKDTDDINATFRTPSRPPLNGQESSILAFLGEIPLSKRYTEFEHFKDQLGPFAVEVAMSLYGDTQPSAQAKATADSILEWAAERRERAAKR